MTLVAGHTSVPLPEGAEVVAALTTADMRDAVLDALPRADVLVTTPHGTARARATELDVWGNTRVSGVDRPPFPVELLDGA